LIEINCGINFCKNKILINFKYKGMKKNLKLIIILLFVAFQTSTLTAQKKSLKVPLGDASWWTGIINKGEIMPLKNGFEGSFYKNYGNQVQPLIISNDGQTIWSETQYTFQVKNDTIYVNSESNSLVYNKTGNTLKDAFKYASKTYFPPTGELPDELLFSAPQYNTWIELIYNQNQEDILKYANGIINNGFPPGVLMIDDNWQEDYGKWDFHKGRFSDPKMMIDSLHSMGFKVMLWICPFVSPDCDVYRELDEKDILLKVQNSKDTINNSAIIRWWNGASAELDLSNPDAMKWFHKQLDYLQEEYKVDGFKFDAGDFEFYSNVESYKKGTTPQEHCEYYAEIGLEYPLNEYRAMWKMAGKPLVNRLRDKYHTWNDVAKLIPDILVQGVVGYNFTCPDMVGGGDFSSFLPGAVMDQDLIVRSAQSHVLMPMMQFSVAPWRVLDAEHLDAVKKAVEIRKQYTPLILQLAKESAKTGEPIVRSMEYVFPHKGYEKINDQFMLGDKVLVAPIISKDNKRTITLPKGKWRDSNGKVVKGPKILKIDCEINKIPIYEKIK
jgi:alpha-glucosidase